MDPAVWQGRSPPMPSSGSSAPTPKVDHDARHPAGHPIRATGGVNDATSDSIPIRQDGRRRPRPDLSISCRDINVRFFSDRRSTTAIEGLSLDVPAGEFLTLGPSGCSKSTFLRVVADLVQPAAARSRCSTTLRPPRARRDIGFVFQDAALLPWRTALQNVELPLEVANGRSRAGKATPRELLELVGLKGREDAYPMKCPAAAAVRLPARW